MAFEDAVLNGLVQGGTSGIVAIFILKYAITRLDKLSEEHKEQSVQHQVMIDKLCAKRRKA